MSVSPNSVRKNSTFHNNDAFEYYAVGSGSIPVVLLHGLFGNPQNWRSIMEDLADHYQFFALQLPIHAHQDRRPKEFHSISQLTDHVERFLAAVKVDRAVLCGNSLGGQIATDFCLRHPDRAKGLVLTGSAGLFERNVADGKRLRNCRLSIRELALGIFHDPEHVTDELVEDVYATLQDRQYRRFLLKVARATRRRCMAGELAKLDVPTLIVWGRNDSITPPSVAEQFRDRIVGSELAMIDQCGHSAPIEQPEQFARHLHTFLSRLSAA